MDFKGHVGMTDNRRCHPLTVLDDHSRYALGIVACLNETFETVQQSLTAIFRRYGMPARMLMDNGPPWGDLPPIEYDSTDIIRQVQSSGRITHERRDYRLSKALVGQDVALRPTAEGLLGVWFGCQRLGTLDPDQGVLIRRWSEDANRATTATT